MISLPDELLARLDAEAAERGSTRSAMIRDLAEAALGERERLLADRMRQLDGHPGLADPTQKQGLSPRLPLLATSTSESILAKRPLGARKRDH
jgi:metal-responsive CopG/Arc/MetJ family transcriptional regulator